MKGPEYICSSEPQKILQTTIFIKAMEFFETRIFQILSVSNFCTTNEFFIIALQTKYRWIVPEGATMNVVALFGLVTTHGVVLKQKLTFFVFFRLF